MQKNVDQNDLILVLMLLVTYNLYNEKSSCLYKL